MTAKKTAAKKTAAKKATTKAPERVCAYGDRNPVVATRETPRGPQYLCEQHQRQAALLGHKTEPVR